MLSYLPLQRICWSILSSSLGSLALALFTLATLPADALAQDSVKLRVYPVLVPEFGDVSVLSGTIAPDTDTTGQDISFKAPYKLDDDGHAYRDVNLAIDNAALFLSVSATMSTPPDGYALLPTQSRIWDLQSASPIPVVLLLGKNGRIDNEDELAEEVGWLRERSPLSQTKPASIAEYYLRARQAAQYVLDSSPDPSPDKNRFIAVFRYLQIVYAAGKNIGLRDDKSDNATAWLEAFVTKARSGDTSYKRAAGKALDDADKIVKMIGQMTAGMYEQIYGSICPSEASCVPSPSACRVWENMQRHFQQDLVEADLGLYSRMLTRAVLDFSSCLGLALNRAKPAPEMVNTMDVSEAKKKAINQIKFIDLAARHCDDESKKDKLRARKIEIEELTASQQASNAY